MKVREANEGRKKHDKARICDSLQHNPSKHSMWRPPGCVLYPADTFSYTIKLVSTDTFFNSQLTWILTNQGEVSLI